MMGNLEESVLESMEIFRYRVAENALNNLTIVWFIDYRGYTYTYSCCYCYHRGHSFIPSSIHSVLISINQADIHRGRYFQEQTHIGDQSVIHPSGHTSSKDAGLSKHEQDEKSASPHPSSGSSHGSIHLVYTRSATTCYDGSVTATGSAPSSSPPSSPSPSLEAPPPPPSPPSEPTPATEEPPASQESPVASPAETLAATGESGIETSGAVLPSSSGALTRPLSSILSPTVASTTVALDTLPGGVFGVRPTDSPSSSQAGTAEEPSKVVVGGIITAVFVVVAVAIGLFLHYRFRKRRATLGSNDMAVAGGGRIRKKGSMGRASSGSSGSGTYRKFDDDRGSRASTASRMSWFYLDGKKQTNSNFVPASSTSPSLPGDENHHQVGYGQPQHIMADDESINGDGRDAVWRSNADRSDPIGIMSTYKNTSAYNMQQITAESDSDNAIYIPPPPVNAPQPAFGSLPRGSSRQASLNNKNNAYNRDSILSTDTATPILLAMMDATRMGNSTPHSPAPSSTSNQSMPIQAYYGVGRAPTMTAIP
ncbi:hypothetical protein BC829DRAFT_415254 [Chytridium lagenaria]|nr:hypothetical protein BC829DRAFT_415254 [Chytridium lagenaria]